MAPIFGFRTAHLEICFRNVIQMIQCVVTNPKCQLFLFTVKTNEAFTVSVLLQKKTQLHNIRIHN